MAIDPAESAPVTGAPSPRITRAVSLGVRTGYDYLGTVLLGSVVWVILALLLGSGGVGLFSLLTSATDERLSLLASLGGATLAGIGTGPLTAAMFAYTRRVMTHEHPDWWELFLSLPHVWRRGLGLAALQGVVSLVLVVDAFFFLAQAAPVLRLVGMLFLYPLLFWWGTSLLQWPLAADRTEDPVWLVVKKSALLLLDNLGYTFVLGMLLLLFTAFCVTSRIGLIFLLFTWAGLSAFVQTAALRELLPKYGLPATPTEDQVAEQV